MAEKIFTFISKGPKGDPGDPGLVQSIVAGSNVTVDSTDPANPIVSAADSSIANLDDIGDVNAPTPTDGYALCFDTTSQTWVAAERVKSLTDGQGITTTEVQSGVYSVEVDLTAGDGIEISGGVGNDVVISATGVQSIVAGDNITVDSTDPANPIVSAADSSIANLDDIGDVNAPTPTDGYALCFDTTTQTWVPEERVKSLTDGAGITTTEVQSGVYSVGVNLTAGDGIEITAGVGNDVVITATGGGGDTLWQETTEDITPTVVKPVRVSALNFNPTGSDLLPHVEGQLQFNTVSRTVRMCGAAADTHLDFGREMWVRVKNTTGSTITNGSVVVINGGTTGLSDQVATITLAQANAKSTCHTLAMATTTIANGDEGEVCIGGFTRDIDLNGYTVGSVLYVSPTVAGGVTTTEPAFPYFSAKIGVVIKSGTTDGILYVAPDTDPNYQTGTGPGEAQGGETYAIAVAQGTVLTNNQNGNGSYMSCIWIPKATMNVRGFVVFCTQADSGWIAGRMGIYSRGDGSGGADVLLAQTPNRTTNLAVGFNVFTLDTPYTVTANTPYMVAAQFVGKVYLGIVPNVQLNPNSPNHFARVDMSNAPSPATTMITSVGYSTSGNRIWIGIF